MRWFFRLYLFGWTINERLRIFITSNLHHSTNLPFLSYIIWDNFHTLSAFDKSIGKMHAFPSKRLWQYIFDDMNANAESNVNSLKIVWICDFCVFVWNIKARNNWTFAYNLVNIAQQYRSVSYSKRIDSIQWI